jgi:ABC-type transporter Mla MlaB component
VAPDVPDTSAAPAACSISGTTIVVSGPVGAAAMRSLCDRVHLALEGSHVDVIVCDVTSPPEPDASTVDALARSALTARRLGRRIVLRDAPSRLLELVALMGLADVLRCPVGLPLGMVGQTEEREEPGRVEEERQAGDPSVRDVEDLERPRFVPSARPAGLPLPERRGAVRHRRDQS